MSEIRRGTDAKGRRDDIEEMDTRRVKGIYDCKPYTIYERHEYSPTNIITYMVRCITYQLTAAEGDIPRELLCQGMLFFIGFERVGQGISIMRWYEGA